MNLLRNVSFTVVVLQGHRCFISADTQGVLYAGYIGSVREQHNRQAFV